MMVLGVCLRGNGEFDTSAGIIPRSVSELFHIIEERKAQATATVEVQMLQVYLDNVEDLLVDKKKTKKGGSDSSPRAGDALKITLGEHSSTGLVEVEGAVSMPASNAAEVLEIFAKGMS
jgi:hypothetical protein